MTLVALSQSIQSAALQQTLLMTLVALLQSHIDTGRPCYNDYHYDNTVKLVKHGHLGSDKPKVSVNSEVSSFQGATCTENSSLG
jgi:hypothetical protein